jgi:hypothetical protein
MTVQIYITRNGCITWRTRFKFQFIFKSSSKGNQAPVAPQPKPHNAPGSKHKKNKKKKDELPYLPHAQQISWAEEATVSAGLTQSCYICIKAAMSKCALNLLHK